MQLRHPFPKLLRFVENNLQTMELDPDTVAMMQASQTVISQINADYKILSCNLPTQNKSNKDLVFAAQYAVDKILEKDESLLGRIMKSASAVLTYGAGNCQHKVFVATKLLLDYFIQHSLADMAHTPSLAIAYCDSVSDTEGHFFLILNNKVICDPWAQLSFPYSLFSAIKSEFSHQPTSVYEGPVKPFFFIRSDWQCFSAEKEGDPLTADARSTEETFSLVKHGPSSTGAAKRKMPENEKPEDDDTTEQAPKKPRA